MKRPFEFVIIAGTSFWRRDEHSFEEDRIVVSEHNMSLDFCIFCFTQKHNYFYAEQDSAREGQDVKQTNVQHDIQMILSRLEFLNIVNDGSVGSK